MSHESWIHWALHLLLSLSAGSLGLGLDPVATRPGSGSSGADLNVPETTCPPTHPPTRDGHASIHPPITQPCIHHIHMATHPSHSHASITSISRLTVLWDDLCVMHAGSSELSVLDVSTCRHLMQVCGGVGRGCRADEARGEGGGHDVSRGSRQKEGPPVLHHYLPFLSAPYQAGPALRTPYIFSTLPPETRLRLAEIRLRLG